jgi:hypothetical protein
LPPPRHNLTKAIYHSGKRLSAAETALATVW